MAGYGYGYGYPQYGTVPQQYQQQQQIQNGGLVSVRSENEARMYPVAPGTSVTFKDENAPYVYTKTAGFSQLDMPVFEKYRLVKEEPQAVPQQVPQGDYALKSDLDVLIVAYNELKKDLDALRTAPATTGEENTNDQTI